MLGFEIFIKSIKNSFNFTGVTSRKDFIIFTIWEFITTFLIAGGILQYANGSVIVVLLYTASIIVINFPSISIAFRRFNDSNTSGWWLILNYAWFICNAYIRNNLDPSPSQIQFMGLISLCLSIYILYNLVFKPTSKN